MLFSQLFDQNLSSATMILRNGSLFLPLTHSSCIFQQFHEVGEHWLFDSPLHRRLAAQRAEAKAKAQEEAQLAEQSSEPNVGAQAPPSEESSNGNQNMPQSLPPPLLPTVVNQVAQPAS